MKKYSQKKLQQLYEDLPEDLKEALFFKENAVKIQRACKNAGLDKNESINKVSEQVGYVLLGIIKPGEMEKILTEEMDLKKITARKIRIEITKSVFAPVKKTLENLLDIKIEIPEEIKTKKEEEKKKRRKDKYRESVE